MNQNRRDRIRIGVVSTAYVICAVASVYFGTSKLAVGLVFGALAVACLFSLVMTAVHMHAPRKSADSAEQNKAHGETSISSGALKVPSVPNVWYRYSESDAVLVFIHGVLSNSRDCWIYQDKEQPEHQCYWPELIASDSRFRNIGIFLGGYFTGPDATTYDIRNCADQIYSSLKLELFQGATLRPSVLGK